MAELCYFSNFLARFLPSDFCRWKFEVKKYRNLLPYIYINIILLTYHGIAVTKTMLLGSKLIENRLRLPLIAVDKWVWDDTRGSCYTIVSGGWRIHLCREKVRSNTSYPRRREKKLSPLHCGWWRCVMCGMMQPPPVEKRSDRTCYTIGGGKRNSHPELCRDSGRWWRCQSRWAWCIDLWSWRCCRVWGHTMILIITSEKNKHTSIMTQRTTDKYVHNSRQLTPSRRAAISRI